MRAGFANSPIGRGAPTPVFYYLEVYFLKKNRLYEEENTALEDLGQTPGSVLVDCEIFQALGSLYGVWE